MIELPTCQCRFLSSRSFFGLPSAPHRDLHIITYVQHISFTMPSVSTTSFILAENMRVTRSMSKLATQGCSKLSSFFMRHLSRDSSAAVIVRRPLSDRTTSANTGTPLSVELKASAPEFLPAKPGPSILRQHPCKASFGFIQGGAPRTPEECERLRKERLAFFRRAHAYQRKNLPKLKLPRASTVAYNAPYTREYVGRLTGFHRIILSPALLAPPATSYGGEVLDPDTFAIVPEIREHAPPEWDEWCPTPRPEHEEGVNASMLFVPPISSSGDLYPHDLARYFPALWRKALSEHTCEVRVKKKRSSKARARSGRRRL